MATNPEYIEFVMDQVTGSGTLRSRKMFGEYMIYVDDRPILLICENTVYVKMHEAVAGILKDAPRGNPYTGAKEHYILDVENRELALAAIAELVKVIPIPVKKAKKAT